MNVLFYLGHPAHYHNVKRTADALAEQGHAILYAARNKDVLLGLLAGAKHRATVVAHSDRGSGKLHLLKSVLAREVAMALVAWRFRPDIMVGTDIVITHVGQLLRVPTLLLNEDDAREVPLLARLGFKYATHVLSPRVCDISPYEHKKIAYESYHELAYLHPNHFTPDAGSVDALLQRGGRYFILRFSNLNAHHDEGRRGITDAIALRLIRQLEPHGVVYITSERTLSPPLEPYRLRIDPLDIHHALYYAALYIGDSQTMAAEAAVLGTPSIRFNDFVGKLAYLEELEHVYGLTFGIKTSEPKKLHAKVNELLHVPHLKQEWRRRQYRMLEEKIDFADFLARFIEHYPTSAQKMRGAISPESLKQRRRAGLPARVHRR